jgi:COP9 signalosome complex subunit 1
MGHNDLGELYYQLGDLPAALKSFAQARDYCTTDKHIIEMCLNVSKVCWESGHDMEPAYRCSCLT